MSRTKKWIIGAGAVAAALSALGTVGVQAYRNRPVLQPALEEAIAETKEYHDSDIAAKLAQERALENERLLRFAAEMGQRQAEAIAPLMLEMLKNHDRMLHSGLVQPVTSYIIAVDAGRNEGQP